MRGARDPTTSRDLFDTTFMAFFWRNRREQPPSEDEYQRELDKLQVQAPVPCIWLFGKTGSGKSSVVRYLTGEADATVGEGYRPETRRSRRYDFPDSADPLLTFIDTRGLGEASYDPTEDIDKIGTATQLMIVAARVTDHALEDILTPLRRIRKAAPNRPVLLAVTCLHEATGSLDLSSGSDPFVGWQDSGNGKSGRSSAGPGEASETTVPVPLRTLLEEKEMQFTGLYDNVVPIDLTQAEDGFADPNFGGQRLKQAILDYLPHAYRQALLTLNESDYASQSDRRKRTRWRTLASSALAATAGAVPIPWVDIPAVLGIQTHLAMQVAKIYEQEMTAADWAILSSAAGSRIAIRLGIRELAKFVPFLGIAVGSAGAFAFTYALGMSWAWYFAGKRKGKVPDAEELKEVFAAELRRGRELWRAE